MINNPLFFLVVVYLISSVPFGLVCAKLFHGIDIRKYGDRNPGAANAWKYGSKLAGILGFLLDVIKGALPVYIAKRFWPASEHWLFLTALIAVCGHAFSLYLKFQGGKSLAVTTGVFLSLFESVIPLLWILIYISLPLFGISFPEGVIITLLIAIFQTFVTCKSWYLRLNVILISSIIIYKHKDTLIDLKASNNSILSKFKRLTPK